MLTEWDERINTGHAKIDSQHRVLFALFNRLAKATDGRGDSGDVGAVLSALSIYVIVHFKMEECMMDLAGFLGAAKHVALHTSMRHQIEMLVDKYKSRGIQSIEVLDLLRCWIETHVLIEDILLADFIREKGPSGKST